jgi:hypothetical protein
MRRKGAIGSIGRSWDRRILSQEKRLGGPIAFLQAIKKAPDAFTSGAFE